jgi:hypothetical protein
MQKDRKKLMRNFIVTTIALLSIQLISGCLPAQGLQLASDPMLSSKLGSNEEFNFTNFTHNAKEAPDSYNSLIKSIQNYRLKLAKNFSIQSANSLAYLPSTNNKFFESENEMEGVTNLNPTSFRRKDFGLPRIRFNIQNVTLGASYNYGLNNIWKSGGLGEGPQNSKNPGLSVHAGWAF